MSELRNQSETAEPAAGIERPRSPEAEFGRLEALAELRAGEEKPYDPRDQVTSSRPAEAQDLPDRPKLTALRDRVAGQVAERFESPEHAPPSNAPQDSAKRPDSPREVKEVDEPRLTRDYFFVLPQASYERYLVRDQGNPIPVFDGPPSRADVAQGRIGDCGVIATLGAVAGHRSEAIQNAIRQVGEGEYEVTFHEIRPATPLDPVARPTGDTRTIRLTDELPVRDDHPARELAGAKAETAAWPALLEKAVAAEDQTWNNGQRARWDLAWRSDLKSDIDAQRAKKNLDPAPSDGPTGYDRLQAGSTARDRADMLAALTGQEAEVRRVPSDSQTLFDEFRERLEDGKPILVGTRKPLTNEPAPFRPTVFAFRHVYEVVSVDGDKIHLRNPWGEGREPPAMDGATFLELFRMYNPDGTRTGTYTTLR